MSDSIMGEVIFVGAGPGDPELLTIKGKRALEKADLVVYAGSLVSPLLLEYARPGAKIYDSSGMDLQTTHSLIKNAAQAGKTVVRLHTGDPAIYGAIAEQIELLDEDGIPWKIIPGVTAATAVAAAAGISFSVPEITQSLIITRLAGRTPMPTNESLEEFAAHGTAMAIYLAGHKCDEVQKRLSRVLPQDTPVICASMVGWPQECIVRSSLGELAEQAQCHGFGRQTMLLILPGHGEKGKRSRLYASDFSHAFRNG